MSKQTGHAKNRRSLRLIQRALTQPPHIVWFRLKQEFALLLMRYFGMWGRHQRAVESRWLTGRFTAANQLIDEHSLSGAKVILEQKPEMARQLQNNYRQLLNGRIEVFGELLEASEQRRWPWHTDWRFAHIWRPAYFKSYEFYQPEKEALYDIKFPWELSRLGFLVPASLWAAVNHEHEWHGILADILDDWLKENPVAYSVNWNSMECSIRAINLVLITQLTIHAADMAGTSPKPVSEQERAMSKLLTLCELHGTFIYRNIEYTDVRGNHYAANVTALILLGLLLKDAVPEAGKWLEYGLENVDAEIMAQYCADGVQIEKSIPYHRFVTQLFFLSAISLEKAGSQISELASDRLYKACRYVSAYMRPDGRAPNWGDNDDANVFCFDMCDSSDHRNLLQLADAWFGNGKRSMTCGEHPSMAVPLFVPDGRRVVRDKLLPPISATEYFMHGGMAIVRNDGYFFMTDVGEVGLMGRGGHGHLDTLSFELMIESEPIVIDIGSYIYTGDATARNYFRSTKAHNVALVDGAEMASLDAGNMWRLGNEAAPYGITVDEEDGVVQISARHDGYRTLDDPVTYGRRYHVYTNESRLTITDEFDCNSQHLVELVFHFAPGISAELGDNGVKLRTAKGLEYALNCPIGTAAIESDWVSCGYGTKLPASTLHVRAQIQGSSQIQTEIRTFG